MFGLAVGGVEITAPTLSHPAFAAPAIIAEALDRYLADKGSSLAGQGSALVESGRRWDVDPRLVVAIAGAESTFGTRLCAEYNAWNWFYKDTSNCSANAFTSWKEGIERATRGLRQLYLDRDHTTIPKIAEVYTATDRETWIRNVTLFYETELGGDPNDLTFVEGPAPQPETPSGDTKVLFISGFRSYNNSEDPAAVNSWAAIREGIQHDSLLRETFQGEDFQYFSYSGFYGSRSHQFGMPIYTPEDTYPHPSNVPSPLSHTVAFDAILLDNMIERFPDSHFILIGHSLGGIVATYWAANKADRQELDQVDLIITLASPLRGIPQAESDFFPDVLELAPDTQVIRSLGQAPGKVRMFTIRSADDLIVSSDYATLPGVRHDMHGDFGDHSGIKQHPYVRVAIAAAIRARNEGKEPLDASLFNAPAYDVVLPQETAQITLEVQNTGFLAWEPDQGYALKATDDVPEEVPNVLSLSEPVPPGDTVTWPLRFPTAGNWGVRRYNYRMHYRDTPFGQTLTAYVFILPAQLGDLEDQIRDRIEEWRRRGEQEIEELIQEILRSIQEELERQARSKLDEVCGGSGGAFVLLLA